MTTITEHAPAQVCVRGWINHPLRAGRGDPGTWWTLTSQISRMTTTAKETTSHSRPDRHRLSRPDHRGTGGRGSAKARPRDLIIEPDAIAAIVRDKEGKYHVHTSHHPVGTGATWGMFWGLLFGVLFFVPVFGLAIGAGLGALMGKITKSGIDKAFQDQVRDMLKPGTSALFLMVEKVTPDKAVEALSKYGGTVLKTSLSKDADKELQDSLHGGGSEATAS